MNPQVWELRIPATDVALQRLHLDVDGVGRVYIHEAIATQLLEAAGWTRVRLEPEVDGR